MAFLDNIGKKANEVAVKASQKAKELSETSRLTSLISDEEKSIVSNYTEIGKRYASLHQQDYEEAFSEMLESIRNSEENIKNYRQQIQDIKGIQRCEKCGAEVPRNAAFCSSCGASMPKVQEAASENLVQCPSCGAQVKKGVRFCTVCGKSMAETPDFEAEPGPAVEAEKTNENAGAANTCPNCGAEIEDGVDFCTQCGTKI